MHPDTPYALAIWTFSGRRWGQAHLRQAGVGDLLFEDAAASAEPRRRQDRRDSSAAASEANGLEPRLKEPLKVFWGYEDSGFLPSPPHAYGSMASGPAVKDLELVSLPFSRFPSSCNMLRSLTHVSLHRATTLQIWELLNIQGKGDWSPFNSLIVDDQISNGVSYDNQRSLSHPSNLRQLTHPCSHRGSNPIRSWFVPSSRRTVPTTTFFWRSSEFSTSCEPALENGTFDARLALTSFSDCSR